MLLGEIFRGKDIGSLPLFQQKAAAGNLGLGIAVVAMIRVLSAQRKTSTTKGTKVHEGKPQVLLREPSCPWWLKPSLPSSTVYKSLDAVFQMNNVEVYEKSERSSTQF